MKQTNRRQQTHFPRTLIGFAALALVVGAAAAGVLPMPLAALYFAVSGVSYLAYLFDKRAAGKGVGRTPEKTLHLMDLLGGWPGALIAQQQFRHKTSKRSFQIMFWLTVVLNLIGAWWLVTSGTAAQLTRTLTG